MREQNVEVPTPDGPMSVFCVVPPSAGSLPGVLIYMDVFGPREELRAIARRFARCGYVALLPHLFHRLGSPVFAPNNRFDDPANEAANHANNVTSTDMSLKDTEALLDFAASGGLGVQVHAWGAVGYCMGGRHAVSAAVNLPKQVRAAISVHGGKLVDASASSTHRLAAQTAVPLHFAFARNDPSCPPEHQRAIEEAITGSRGLVSVELHDAHHGWSFPDRWCFDHRESERVWDRALGLFRDTLCPA